MNDLKEIIINKLKKIGLISQIHQLKHMYQIWSVLIKN
jgi:hypothetical protein